MKINSWQLKPAVLVLTTAILLLIGVIIFQNVHAAKEVHMPAPNLQSEQWLNSAPKTMAALRGKVVLVEFWTFGCYNCVNVEPYIKQWHSSYHDQGLEVIAVHTPEFSHEHDINNVRAYIESKKIQHAVAIDNDFKIWKSFDNHYWPALYLIDKRGNIRYIKIGEGEYAKTQQRIVALLAE